MDTWSEKINKVTQSAISKSKEMAETAKINRQINTYTQTLKELYTQVGERVIEKNLLQGKEDIADLEEQIMLIKSNIEEEKEKLNVIRNIIICPNCKAEISGDSRFCEKCGTEIKETIVEVVEEKESVCKNCGEPLVEGAVFCGNCGSRQE